MEPTLDEILEEVDRATTPAEKIETYKKNLENLELAETRDEQERKKMEDRRASRREKMDIIREGIKIQAQNESARIGSLLDDILGYIPPPASEIRSAPPSSSPPAVPFFNPEQSESAPLSRAPPGIRSLFPAPPPAPGVTSAPSSYSLPAGPFMSPSTLPTGLTTAMPGSYSVHEPPPRLLSSTIPGSSTAPVIPGPDTRLMLRPPLSSSVPSTSLPTNHASPSTTHGVSAPPRVPSLRESTALGKRVAEDKQGSSSKSRKTE